MSLDELGSDLMYFNFKLLANTYEGRCLQRLLQKKQSMETVLKL